MSKGNHGGAHAYRGVKIGRGARLASKLGRCLDLARLEKLLRDAHALVVKARESQR